MAEQLTYRNPVWGWEIRYPSDWSLDDSDPEYVVWSFPAPPALPGAQLGINSGDVTPGQTHAELVDFLVSTYEESTRMDGMEAVQVSQQELESAGPRGKTVFTYDLGGAQVGRVRMVLVSTEDGRMFLINQEAYRDAFPSFEPDFDSIVDSFAVTARTGS